MARGDFPSAKQDQYMVRFPDGMREEIKRLASEDGRSMNAQIVELLNFALQNSGVDMDDIMRMIVEQRNEINRLRDDQPVTKDETKTALIFVELAALSILLDRLQKEGDALSDAIQKEIDLHRETVAVTLSALRRSNAAESDVASQTKRASSGNL